MESAIPPGNLPGDLDFGDVQPETEFRYEAPGPKFVDLVRDKKPRINQLSSTYNPYEPGIKPTIREFSERQGLDNLDSYFKHVEGELQKVSGKDVDEMKTMLTHFRDNLVFIGEPELETALTGMAQYVIHYAREGKIAYLVPYGDRSEKYITMRLLEHIDATIEEPELRSRIKLGKDADQIAGDWNDELTQNGNSDIKIIFPDDFLLSGYKLVGSMGKNWDYFAKRHIADPQDFIEGLAVVSGIHEGKDSSYILRNGNITSFYGIPEHQGTGMGEAMFTGIAVTGSHASADYSFDVVIDQIQQFLKTKGLQVPDTPLLHNINRIYEPINSGSSKFASPELQQRWDKMEQKFGIR